MDIDFEFNTDFNESTVKTNDNNIDIPVKESIDGLNNDMELMK